MISILGDIKWKSITGCAEDDWIDRASHLWTVCLLLLFGVVVSSGQYVGDPIHCWCPAEFTATFVQYTKNFCWISSTYFIPMETGIPSNFTTRPKPEINYYQWVPMILLFMAFLFKTPNVIWHLLHTKSGINLSKLCEMTDNMHIGKPDEREKLIKEIVTYIARWLHKNRSNHRSCIDRKKLSNIFYRFAGHDGYFLIGFYLFVKILYAINCVGQFFLLDAFLGMNFSGYGFEMLSYFPAHDEWSETPRFPRITLCDFDIRDLQNIQQFTVQCVLPINLFNEKIFAALWFWMFLISVLTFFNLANWLFYLLFKHNKELFVRKYLRAADEIQSRFDKRLSRQFANDFLRADGCFVLRIVGKNSADVILSDLIKQLWVLFKQDQYQNEMQVRTNGVQNYSFNNYVNSSEPK